MAGCGAAGQPTIGASTFGVSQRYFEMYESHSSRQSSHRTQFRRPIVATAAFATFFSSFPRQPPAAQQPPRPCLSFLPHDALQQVCGSVRALFVWVWGKELEAQKDCALPAHSFLRCAQQPELGPLARPRSPQWPPAALLPRVHLPARSLALGLGLGLLHFFVSCGRTHGRTCGRPRVVRNARVACRVKPIATTLYVNGWRR